MKERKEIALLALFYGGLWGILEATLGFALHLSLPLGLGTGVIMFGLAAVIMYKAGEKNEEVRWFVPLVSAMIKLTNLVFVLALPDYTMLMVLKVVNPAVAILIEGLALGFVFKMIKDKNVIRGIGSVLAASLIWHIGYVMYQFILFNLGFQSPFFKDGLDAMARIIIPGIIGGAISSCLYYIIRSTKLDGLKFELKPIYSYCSLALAIILTVVL